MTRRAFLGAGLAAAARGQDILHLSAPKADARISYGRDPSQFGDLRIPAGPGRHPVAIVLHGGFWSEASGLVMMAPFCEALKRAGVATWNLEYRRLGNPGAGWPGTFEDVENGGGQIRLIAKKYPLDLNRTIAAGHGAGGTLVLWLAAQMAVDLRGVVGLAAIADLQRAWALRLDKGVVGKLLGGAPGRVPKIYTAADPMKLLPISPEQRLLYGTADEVVPIDIGQRFAKASHNSHLITVQGAGHYGLIDPRAAAWKTVEPALTQWTW